MEFNHIYSRYVFKDSNNTSKHCTTTDYNITQNLKRILCGGSEAMSTSDAIMAEEEREAKKDDIRRNVKDSITAILQAMTTIDPPVACADPALEERYKKL